MSDNCYNAASNLDKIKYAFTDDDGKIELLNIDNLITTVDSQVVLDCASKRKYSVLELYMPYSTFGMEIDAKKLSKIKFNDPEYIAHPCGVVLTQNPVRLEMYGCDQHGERNFAYLSCNPSVPGLYENVYDKFMNTEEGLSAIFIVPYRDCGWFVNDGSMFATNASIHILRSNEKMIFLICNQESIFSSKNPADDPTYAYPVLYAMTINMEDLEYLDGLFRAVGIIKNDNKNKIFHTLI